MATLLTLERYGEGGGHKGLRVELDVDALTAAAIEFPDEFNRMVGKVNRELFKAQVRRNARVEAK